MTTPSSRPAPPAGHTPKPITPQKVRAVLRKAGFPETEYGLPGVYVSPLQPKSLSFRVGYEDAAYLRNEIEHRKQIGRIAAALAAVGIRAEVRNGEVWVPVDQTGQEPT